MYDDDAHQFDIPPPTGMKSAEQIERLTDRAYESAVSSLSIGNSGGPIATIAFIGSTWNNGDFYQAALLPLGLFMIGMIAVGAGTLTLLMSQLRAAQRVRQAPPSPAMTFHPFEQSVPCIGCLVVSGSLFVFGCLSGFFELAYTLVS